MIIFEYKVLSNECVFGRSKVRSCARITDDLKDNVFSCCFGKEYYHTLSREDVDKIKEIINKYPELFVVNELEPNIVSENYEYSFVFSDGVKTNSFIGYDILDYGSRPRKNATMALRVARHIKDYVLRRNEIRTAIPDRLQHWPRYRKRSNLIKI